MESMSTSEGGPLPTSVTRWIEGRGHTSVAHGTREAITFERPGGGLLQLVVGPAGDGDLYAAVRSDGTVPAAQAAVAAALCQTWNVRQVAVRAAVVTGRDAARLLVDGWLPRAGVAPDEQVAHFLDTLLASAGVFWAGVPDEVEQR